MSEWTITRDNFVISEAVLQSNSQDFKKGSPFFFSFLLQGSEHQN